MKRETRKDLPSATGGRMARVQDDRLLESVIAVTREILECVRAERFHEVEELFAKRMILIRELRQSAGCPAGAAMTDAAAGCVREFMELNHSIIERLEDRKQSVIGKLRVLNQKRKLELYSY